MWTKSNFRFYILLILGLTLDRTFKILSQFYFLTNNKSWFLNFSLNQVAAWSWPISNHFLIWFNAIAILAIFIVYLYISPNKKHLAWALILIISGAYSNLYDRWFFGGVIDYWSVFNLVNLNLADIFITWGCVILIKQQFFTNQDIFDKT